MSSAHICIRSVLTQAFRLSNARAVAATVPDFLVPAVARRPRRPFHSSTCRRRADVQEPTLRFHSKPRRPSSISKIPFPAIEQRDDVQAWLAVIDPFLPFLLRRDPSNDPDVSSEITPLDLAQVINAAQDASVDILGHIGLVEERWDAVVWIANKLVEHEQRASKGPAQLDPFENVIWPEGESRSLRHLTNSPLRTQRARPSRKLKYTLDDLTSMPDTINFDHRILKRALGQLWRSLGSAILVAAERDPAQYDIIMARVLEILAHLHHIGFIPESVYTHKSNPDIHALQQPPTLHLLYTQILTALSDASWRAHEASVKVATERLNASYFLGHEIPGSRYKVKVTAIRPELWLELILWSCLHGGWLLDGTAILEEMISPQRQRPWRLISWRELLQAREIESAQRTGFGLYQRREDVAAAQPEDRARTERTISSELVTAFVDGLVNDMRLGVGARGTAPEDLVKHIKTLKQFLDMNKLSLGSTTWDSIMSRLLESGGIVPEKRPALLLSILDLASVFGTEVSSANAPSKEALEQSEPPYFYEPTTVALNLLHQTLRLFIKEGDVANAMNTFKVLQQFTDINKQKSLEQFFERLKTVQINRIGSFGFDTKIPPIEFPAFDTQLPIPLLAKLLDLVTSTKMYNLGRHFLFSEDLDGPLIPESMYGNWTMAASIIRFGTMAGENKLVAKIVERSAAWNDNTQTYRMPHEYLTAVLSSQIKLHRWKSVRGMHEHVLNNPGYKMQPEILATIGAELLRSASTTSENDASERSQIRHAFTDFLFTWEDLVLSDLRNELNCVLAMLSSVSEDWKQFCGQFLSFSARQGIKLSTTDFNHLLSGVLDGYGSSKGKDFVDLWCYKLPETFEPYHSPGGLPTMPKYRPEASEQVKGRPAKIELEQPSGARLVLVGRVPPNRWTVQVILRKMQQEQEERGQHGRVGAQHAEDDGEVRETLRWATRLLYHLGFDYEDVVRDLGSLAELAPVEAPSGLDRYCYYD